MDRIERFVISVLVANHSGVLSRVSGMFTRRGFNIDTLTVGETESPEFSRITISTHCDRSICNQIVKQLEKMYDVKTVKVMKRDQTVIRELLLIKINNVADKRQDIMSVVDVFRAKITDYSPEALVIEIRGESSKINAFIELLEPYGIMEMCRTGLVALERGGRNFHADTRIPAAKLPLALNQHLPPDIRVLDAQPVPEDFHARYAAHTKTYLYRIHNHPIDSPFDAAYYTRVPRHLDEARMQAAAQQFVGRHDFLALCAAGSSAAAHGDTVRTITDCHVTRKGDEIDIEVTADGYLYNMVRILAGTLCEVGAGRLRAADIPAILASRDRSRAGPTLPAKGLFLKCVDYPERKQDILLVELLHYLITDICR